MTLNYLQRWLACCHLALPLQLACIHTQAPGLPGHLQESTDTSIKGVDESA